MKQIRKIAMWMAWNIPLGRMAPYVLGVALNSRPRKIPHDLPAMENRVRKP